VRPTLQLAHSAPLPDPPYPEGTKAAGWRFQFDHERCEGSDTWALAPAEIKPWLLMMWYRAWTATPCGTFSNDDAIIAARIGMPLTLFQMNRDVLLRGWTLHSDGRLYHHVLTQRVTELLEFRGKQKARIDKRWERVRATAGATPQDTGGIPRYSTVVPLDTIPIPIPIEKQTHTSPADLTLAPAPAVAGPAVAGCPHDAIVALYHEILPGNPRVMVWNAQRQSMLRQRWREEPKRQSLDWWRGYFEFCTKSPFLIGKAPPSPGRPPFVADLEWLIGAQHLPHVIEGRYHRGNT